MLIYVKNHLWSQSIEVSLKNPSCSKNQDKFSGASPWCRMHDNLEQHGMCSHSTRVSYERMNNNMLQALPSSKNECTEQFDKTHDSSYWVCDRATVNWTWVRERPDFLAGHSTQNLCAPNTCHIAYYTTNRSTSPRICVNQTICTQRPLDGAACNTLLPIPLRLVTRQRMRTECGQRRCMCSFHC